MGASRLAFGGRALPVPAFFPSVSSVKTNLLPSEYVRILGTLGEPQLLVSAYDLATLDDAERSAIQEAVGAVSRHGCAVLLDSGNYERFWHRDATWTIERYAATVRSCGAPIAFSYDELEPLLEPRHAADAVVAGVHRDQAWSSSTTICPIVHGLTPEALAETASIVAERLQPLLVAVPERELGNGLVARAGTVRRMVKTIADVAPGTSVHILGTGSPVALLVYAIAGALSFDGLEWCQTCVDPDSAHLHHFQHRDLVRTIEPSLTTSLPYAAGTLVHNLLFFRGWMTRVRESLANGTADGLLESVIPKAGREALTVLTAQ